MWRERVQSSSICSQRRHANVGQLLSFEREPILFVCPRCICLKALMHLTRKSDNSLDQSADCGMCSCTLWVQCGVLGTPKEVLPKWLQLSINQTIKFHLCSPGWQKVFASKGFTCNSLYPSTLEPFEQINSKPSTGKKKKLQREWILLSAVGVRNTDHNSNDTAFRVPSAVERCQIEYRTVPKWPLLLGGNAPLVRFHSDAAEGVPVNTFTPLR